MNLFNSVETKEHMRAKSLLFDLIIMKKVKFIDHEGEEIEVFPHRYKTEFLHSESLILGESVMPMYSSKTSALPCVKYFSPRRSDTFTPMCDLRGHYGAIFELPCIRCLYANQSKNFDKLSKLIGLRADIAWGYANRHRVWIEIYYKGKSTYRKMRFCHKNNIILLEVKAEDVLNCDISKDNNILICENLTKIYDKLDKDKWEEIIIKDIQEKLDEYGYVKKSYLLDQLKGFLWKNQLNSSYKKILEKMNLIETKGASDVIIKQLKLYNISKNTVLLIPKPKIENMIKNKEVKHVKINEDNRKLYKIRNIRKNTSYYRFIKWIEESDVGIYKKKDIVNMLKITNFYRVMRNQDVIEFLNKHKDKIKITNYYIEIIKRINENG